MVNADEDVFCFFDERLRELRNVYNPSDVFKLNDFEVEYYKDLVRRGDTFNKAFRQEDESFEMV